MVTKKNKKGWIKIIEAFISILFLIGVVAIIIQSDNFSSKERPTLEKKQVEILNSIELNETLRIEVLNSTNYTINSNDPAFSTKLKNYIDTIYFDSAECFLMVCSTNGSCDTTIEKDEMYTKSVLITSTITEYNPKKLKIFCYETN